MVAPPPLTSTVRMQRPPALSADAEKNVQLSYLVNNFVLQVGQLLNIPADHALASTAVDAAVNRLANHASFPTVAVCYTNRSTCAIVLRGLATLSAKVSEALLAPTPEDRAEKPETADSPPASAPQIPPYLRAATAPPRPVNRLPPIVDADARGSTRHPIRLSRNALSLRGSNRQSCHRTRAAHCCPSIYNLAAPRSETLPASLTRGWNASTSRRYPEQLAHRILRHRPTFPSRGHQATLRPLPQLTIRPSAQPPRNFVIATSLVSGILHHGRRVRVPGSYFRDGAPATGQPRRTIPIEAILRPIYPHDAGRHRSQTPWPRTEPRSRIRARKHSGRSQTNARVDCVWNWSPCDFGRAKRMPSHSRPLLNYSPIVVGNGIETTRTMP